MTTNRTQAPSRSALLLALACFAGLALPLTLPSVAIAQGGLTKAPDAPAAGVGAKADNLEIRRITLYRSGVGSFLRQGAVQGDANVQLRFKTDQINDILKSMIVLDLSGGQIEGVSYASKEPLSRRLASFGVDISDAPSLPDLLAKLRGATASITTSEGAASGTILGVEYREQASSGDAKPIKVAFLNLVTAGGMRAFDLTKASSVELQDKELAGELNKALTALAEHRADRTKTVEVALRGAGTRNVAVGYIHEMPVWKASYRIVLPDEKAAADAKPTGAPSLKKGELSLQGWAIVENPTDEDWNNVTLSLVSGRPVSFQMDLYEPLFVARPEVPVPTVPGVAPRMYAGGVALSDEQASAVRAGGGQSPFGGGGSRGESGATARKSKAGAPGSPPNPSAMPAEAMADNSAAFDRVEDMAGYAAAARAQAVESGEVFQYELKTPVTIERQRSAMLPIINQGVEGRRVSIYSRSDGSEHPMRGLEVKNTTDLQLLPGPISVYDGTAYAGDAQVGHVAPGEKRLVSYAVDLDVTTITKDESTSDVRKLRIIRGLLEQTNLSVNNITYQFTNKSLKHDRTIVVEHPKLPGHELKSADKPAEETQSLYRFEVAAAPGKQGKLTVTQQITFNQQFALLNYDLNTMASFQTQGKASKAVLDAFREAARRQAEIESVANEIQRMDRERNEITQDQSRVRENMKAIDKGTELYSTYIKKFSDQEKRVNEIATQLTSARQRQTELQATFETWLGSLNID
jgi:hypothetical protein